MLTVATDDRPTLSLADEKGIVRAFLGVAADGPPWLGLADEKGMIRAGLGLAEHGIPKLEFFDQKGTTRAVLGATRTTTAHGKVITYPESSLLLFGPDGEVRWEAP